MVVFVSFPFVLEHHTPHLDSNLSNCPDAPIGSGIVYIGLGDLLVHTLMTYPMNMDRYDALPMLPFYSIQHIEDFSQYALSALGATSSPCL